jgi:hypothetical protein
MALRVGLESFHVTARMYGTDEREQIKEVIRKNFPWVESFKPAHPVTTQAPNKKTDAKLKS